METATQSEQRLETWAILELMGHRRLAGYLSERVIAGKGMLQIDIPKGDGMVTQFYGPDSVYAITPTNEATARQCASNWNFRPVHSWDLLPAPTTWPGVECDEHGRPSS